MDEKAATAIADLLTPANPEREIAQGRRACYLILVRGETPGAMVRLAEGSNRLGRSEDNAWQIRAPDVSRHHALIQARHERATLIDLGSTNGTFLNGRRLAEHDPSALNDGDRVRFGAAVDVKFVRPDACEERFHRELYERAVRDPLTGLYNRGFFLEQAATLAARVSSRGMGLAVIVLDVDHFKKVNDRHGHDTGDAVLREVATVIRQSTRSEDLVARYGGEEFVAALPVASRPQAAERAERIRASLASRAIALPEGTLNVTASLGVAFAPPGWDRAIASLLTEADSALYLAKRSGRDRVVVTPEPACSTEEFSVALLDPGLPALLGIRK